ncbi:MAG: HTH-type transcriptional regulator DmlR [Candidatus Celerinatantimonas neptuna]|nr:MAG: HTH-type transcriptional regulator DmlR [Candidatus Celerinatantimonas neptuna]
MDNFSTIPFFIAVVETGSFSAAARKLSMTKSAVSKRISQLEADLGVRLIHRTTRKLSLTEAGQKYYEYVQAAAMLALEGKDAITQMQSQAMGMLRITVPMVFGQQHLSELIPNFLQEYPQIELQMSMDDRVVDLVGQGIDLGVRIGQLHDSSLIAVKLSPCHSVVCASPEYIRLHGQPKIPEDLVKHNCMVYSYFQGGATWLFNHANGPVRVLPRGNYRVNSSAALYDALLAGVGISQMPTFIVGPALSQGRLVSLLRDYPLPVHHIYAVYPQRRFLPGKVRLMLDYLREHLGEGSDYQARFESL